MSAHTKGLLALRPPRSRMGKEYRLEGIGEGAGTVGGRTVKNLDLDQSDPAHVAGILRAAAERYREAHTELAASWQDKNAGRIWSRIATILDRAARSVDNLPGN